MLRFASSRSAFGSNVFRRKFSSKSTAQPSSATAGGGSGGVGSVFFAGLALVPFSVLGLAYHLEHNPEADSLKGTIEKFPGLPDAVTGARSILSTIGLGAKAPTLAEVKAAPSAIAAAVRDAENDASARAKEAQESRLKAAAKKEAAEKKAREDAEAAQKAAEAADAARKQAEESRAKHAKEEAEKATAAQLAQAKAAEEKTHAKRVEADKAAKAALAAPIPEAKAVTPVAHTDKGYTVLPAVSSELAGAASTAQAASGSHSHSVPVPVVEFVLSDLTKQAIELRKELEATLLADLHELDEHALRTRVTQLAAEFFERTKWEGVRVHQSMKQVEAELHRKYADLLKQQRSELEFEANKQVMAREQAVIARAYTEAQDQVLSHEKHYAATLKKKELEHQQEMGKALAEQALALTEDMQDQMNNDVANLRAQQVQLQLAVQAQISALEAELSAFQEATVKLNGLNHESANVHKFSAAVLNLQDALVRGKPLAEEAACVAKYANAMDPLVATVVESLPASLLQSGAPSVEELKLRFNVVRTELRKVAMAPEALPSVVGQVVGAALAKIYWQPSGPVAGDGAEEVMSRVVHRLEGNDLKAALLELGSISDPISVRLMADWRTKAENRLAADQAAKVLRAQAVLKHVQFGNAAA